MAIKTDSKAKLFPKTGVGVVADTNTSLTWDVLEQQLVVIVADVVAAPAAGGDTLWPKMTPQNKSSFWGPLN